MTKTKILPIARKIFNSAEKRNYDLSGCFNLNNKYYITDGYRAIRLDKDYTIPILSSSDSRKTTFEKIEKIFNDNIAIMSKEHELSLPSLDDLKEMKKSTDRYDFGNSWDSPMVNINYLEDMLKLDAVKAWYNIDNRSIYFKCKDGTDAILMVIRK